jgi:hypothetical protein
MPAREHPAPMASNFVRGLWWRWRMKFWLIAIWLVARIVAEVGAAVAVAKEVAIASKRINFFMTKLGGIWLGMSYLSEKRVWSRVLLLGGLLPELVHGDDKHED